LFTGNVPLSFKSWQLRTDIDGPGIGKNDRNHTYLGDTTPTLSTPLHAM
jgi:hypothetical protein